MHHVINFTGRLAIDSPAVPVAEILQKIQIVQTSQKDVQDTMMFSSNTTSGKKINSQPTVNTSLEFWEINGNSTTRYQETSPN
jgi:hypothetical protein